MIHVRGPIADKLRETGVTIDHRELSSKRLPLSAGAMILAFDRSRKVRFDGPDAAGPVWNIDRGHDPSGVCGHSSDDA